jgi:hypothetical protein
LAIGVSAPGEQFLIFAFPALWAIPTMMLSEAAAAAPFGLINSLGQLGGFAWKLRDWFFDD